MVVAKIQEQISAYKRHLGSQRDLSTSWWWESVQHFQMNWNLEASDLIKMLDASFQSSVTKRLWQLETWRPKEIMTLFLREQPLMVKAMFADLFNETKEVEMRVSRFLFGCDMLLEEHKRNNPGSIENNHYHGDYRMLALYLAFRYPDKYAAPYDFVVFKEALSRLGARDLPQADDLFRFFKVHRTIQIFLEKDGAVLPAINRFLYSKIHYMGPTLLPAVDFLQFVARNDR
jgi:hypothetical protein